MPLLGPDGTPLSEQTPAGSEPVPDTGPIPCVTAYVLYMLPDGKWQVADDLNVPLVPERKPHGDDFTAGASVVLRDVQTSEVANIVIPNVAQAVINGQMQLARHAMDQRQNEVALRQMQADQARGAR